MTGDRALVTGATGFIGSHLVRRLVREGVDVHILCREQSNFWRIEDVLPQVTRHIADLRNVASLDRAVAAARPDHVYHLAAATVVAGSTDAAHDLIDINVMGTVNLIAACEAIEYCGLVTTGDSFEYTPSMERLAEADACHPASLHGISKFAATLHAEAVGRGQGRPIITLRLFSTYGPGDNPRRLVPKVIADALAGYPLALSRPDIVRDWVYIDDVVDLYLEAASKAGRYAGGVFNAGSGERGTLADVVEFILKLTGSEVAARWGVFEAPAHDAWPWVADPAHTFAHFEWRPRISLEEGLSRTIAAIKVEDPHG